MLSMKLDLSWGHIGLIGRPCRRRAGLATKWPQVSRFINVLPPCAGAARRPSWAKMCHRHARDSVAFGPCLTRFHSPDFQAGHCAPDRLSGPSSCVAFVVPSSPVFLRLFGFCGRGCLCRIRRGHCHRQRQTHQIVRCGARRRGNGSGAGAIARAAAVPVSLVHADRPSHRGRRCARQEDAG